MDAVEQIYRRNHRRQLGMVGGASALALVLALAPHNERAIFITQPLPAAFGAVPLPAIPTPNEITSIQFGPRTARRLANAFRGTPPVGSIPGILPTGGPGGVGPATPDAVTPPYAEPFAPGETLPGVGGGGGNPFGGSPFVGSPFGADPSSSPVGPLVTPTPTPTSAPTPTPTSSPTPTPTGTPTPTPTGTPTPTPTGTPTPTPTSTPTPTPTDTPTTPVIPAVPEPMTWLLMMAGFFVAGSALRHNRRGQSAQLESVSAETDRVESRQGALPE